MFSVFFYCFKFGFRSLSVNYFQLFFIFRLPPSEMRRFSGFRQVSHHTTNLHDKNLRVNNLPCFSSVLQPACHSFRQLNCAKYRKKKSVYAMPSSVNSPRSERRRSCCLCAAERFCPNTYINLATAASVVMSCPQMTPDSCNCRPVS